MATRFVAFCLSFDSAGRLLLADLGQYSTLAAADRALTMQRYKPAVGVAMYGPDDRTPLIDMTYTVRAGGVPDAAETRARLEAAAPQGRPWPSRILAL